MFLQSGPSVNEPEVDVSIVTVATNIYLEYWKKMVRSAIANLPARRAQFVVFTDDPQSANVFASQYPESLFSVVGIPSYGWPEATLYRYKLINDNASRISGSIVVHVDADMLFVSNAELLTVDSDESCVTLVKHPGYRRPLGLRRLEFYLRSPSFLIKDVLMRIRLGALGSWETNPLSSAFVPRSRRQTYVAGGLWWGHQAAILSMCASLADRTKVDDSTGIVAKWHDESHLNWFAATHTVRITDSGYCFAEGYLNLADVAPVIVASVKEQQTR